MKLRREVRPSGRARRLAHASALCAASAALAIAGCGSDEDEGSGSPGASATATSGATTAKPAAELQGEPVKIMMAAAVTSPAGGSIVSPETKPAAEAMTKWVNANGGIGGRPLETIICDNQVDPNRSRACAREAVSEKVVASVGSADLTGSWGAVLTAAKIPMLSSYVFVPPETTSEYSYPLGSSQAISTSALTQAKEECEKVSIVTIENAGNAALEKKAKIFAGDKFAGQIVVPPTQQDFSAPAAKAAESDCALLQVTSGAIPALVPAIKQANPEIKLFVAEAQAMTSDLLKKLKGQVDGMRLTGTFAPWDSPAWDEFKGILKESGQEDTGRFGSIYGENIYLGYKVLQQVAKDLPDVTAATLQAALRKTTAADLGTAGPKVDISTDWTVPGLRRLTNMSVARATVEGDSVTWNGEFTDIGDIYAKGCPEGC